MSTEIQPYSSDFRDSVIELILSIQTKEFGVPITLADQPDLADVPGFYGRGNGAFWIASDGDRVVGTIALLDIGEQQFALRKMFVHRDYRGKEKGVAARLLSEAIEWAKAHDYRQILLGTIDRMFAAHRFYEKNGFVQVEPKELPTNFPRVAVDNVFYSLDL